MKRALAVLTAAAGLALAPAAEAKELIAVEVCGPDGCNRATDAQTLRDVPMGGETEAPLGRPAAFYRVHFVLGEGENTHSSTLSYIPSQNALAYVDQYESVRALPIFGPTATGTIRRLARGLRPFSAPRVTSVAVGDRVLTGAGAAGYLALFRAGTRVPREYPDEWVPVDLRSAEPTPWTEGARELMYSPEGGVIERGGVLYELPGWLAADLEAARPLGDEPGVPWRTILLSLLGALALVCLVLLARARRGEETAAGLPSSAR
jgi:hypothetical protein